MGGFGWWPIIWSLALLSVVFIIGYGIYAHGGTPAERTDTALSTLRSRYARGELSEEEFEERRHRLEE
ncbi:SHOCT domain-containing protein [Haloarcula sp. GH36]|uniref:SHOCT domain-containing protein n=1 Tax=Haloarcula montana TaxID=3111776 RepID=UPI002D782969|nr:SHOCT domain-containing protein [Haloarcula sp. GH36]